MLNTIEPLAVPVVRRGLVEGLLAHSGCQWQCQCQWAIMMMASGTGTATGTASGTTNVMLSSDVERPGPWLTRTCGAGTQSDVSGSNTS